MSLPLPPPLSMPPLPAPVPAKWKLDKFGYDAAYLHVQATLTRTEVFRLIGELERLGATL